MSFTWFRPEGPLRTREQIAAEVHAVSLARGLDDLATVMCLMAIDVEVGADGQWWCPATDRIPESKLFPHDSMGNDNRSMGYLQQQPGPNGEPWWGTVEDMMTLSRAANTFLSRLPDDWQRARNNPQLAGEMVANVQRPRADLRWKYATRWDTAWAVFNRRGGPAAPPPAGWTGDPRWLADVLRAEGVVVEEKWVDYPEPTGRVNWIARGHGDMGKLWGVVNHHTGSNGSTWQSIWYGRNDLAGPLSHIHLRRDGVAEIVAAGVCWHAGSGGPILDLARGAANQRTIGIECQNDGGGSPGKPHRSSWPDAQYNALVKINAAICRRLGVGADHAVSHQEWDKADPATFEGKWDPGAIDMGIFRADVARQIGTTPSNPDGGEVSPELERMIREIHACLFNSIGSQSIWAGPDEGEPWQLHELIKNDDGMIHSDHIPNLAMKGVPFAIFAVARVAAGEGKYRDQWVIDYANRILEEIPMEYRQQFMSTTRALVVAPQNR